MPPRVNSTKEIEFVGEVGGLVLLSINEMFDDGSNCDTNL